MRKEGRVGWGRSHLSASPWLCAGQISAGGSQSGFPQKESIPPWLRNVPSALQPLLGLVPIVLCLALGIPANVPFLTRERFETGLENWLLVKTCLLCSRFESRAPLSGCALSSCGFLSRSCALPFCFAPVVTRVLCWAWSVFVTLSPGWEETTKSCFLCCSASQGVFIQTSKKLRALPVQSDFQGLFHLMP